MKGPIFLVLVHAAKLAYCSSVTAGGNSSLHLFFCEPKGCAANVTSVYCGNIELLNGTNIPDCSGHPPSLNTVCQHDGRAFAQTEAGIKCDFESKEDFIPTVKCEDGNTACTFDPEATLKEEKKEEKKEEEKEEKREEKKEGKKEQNNAGHIAGICAGILILIIAIIAIIALVRYLECGKKTCNQAASLCPMSRTRRSREPPPTAPPSETHIQLLVIPN